MVLDSNNLNKKLTIKNSKSEILAVDNTFNEELIFSGEKNQTIKAFNLNGQIKYDMKLNGYPTCFLNMERGKKKFLAVGLSNGKVNIYDQKINLCQEIPPNVKIDEKKNILNNEEQNCVASLSIDEAGEYLFIAYKNGVTMAIYLDFNDVYFKEENVGVFKKNKYEINKILFESNFFTIFFIGDNKGLKIK